MGALFILLFSLLLRFSVSSEQGHFYLTILKGHEVTVLNGGSPINTVGVHWTTRSYYNDSFKATGWDVLEIQTNPDLRDEDQAYQAGWIEGFLTHDQIYNHWYNTQRSSCQSISTTCENVKRYLNENWEWIKSKMDTEGHHDPYWHQVKLFYLQIEGLYHGYRNATKNHAHNLKYEDILMVNYVTDIMTLTDSLAHKSEKKHISKQGHCSVLIKLLPGFSDVYFAHNAWITYSFMNRIIKRYNFAYHWSAQSSKIIPGQSQAFSSYGGVITSIDDFYIINSGLFVTETTNNVFKNKIYEHNKPKGQVLESVRSAVANRLATDTHSWSHYFSMMNSGTYNNQWMIIDLKKFRPGFEPERGFLQVLEQMPGMIESRDQTQHIIAHSYWASYNIPFYRNIYEYAGYDEKEKKYGPYYSYKGYARAMIFEREQNKVVDLDSMINLIRYNHYNSDPYSVYGNSTPSHSACLAIASRCDLNPINGSYPLKGLGFALFGAIDAKIGSYSMFKKGEMVAVSGPTRGGGVLPPFKWSSAPKSNSMPHIGQPDIWDFDPILTSWIQPYAQADPNDKVLPIFHTSSKRN